MKLLSITGSMMVDFYPIQTPMGNVSNEWFLKVLTFQGETQSKTFLNRVEMGLEVDGYIDHQYQVVDFNTIPQLANPFAEV
jgi:hypothetical protein